MQTEIRRSCYSSVHHLAPPLALSDASDWHTRHHYVSPCVVWLSRLASYCNHTWYGINLNSTYEFNSQRAENAVSFYYNEQPFCAVQGSKQCWYWDPYKTHKYTVWTERRFLYILHHLKVKVKVKNPITGLDRPWGFQEVETPRFQDIRHMVVRLSALRTGRLYPPGNIPGTHIC